MIPNHDYDFRTRAPRDVKDAFRGFPDKRLLQHRDRYWRVITTGHNRVDGEWWFPEETFDRLVVVSERCEVPLGEAMRALLALSLEFNPRVERLMQVTPRGPIYGFVGRVRQQPLSAEMRNVLLMGGLTQVWIPNVELRHFTLGPSVAL